MTLAPFFGIALDLDPLTLGVFAFFAVIFILMFVITSAKGDAQGIFEWMVEKPAQTPDNPDQMD